MNTRGFTMIELLVVMVILSLTVSLLASGLATTWSNFDRLGARALSGSAASLPKTWFSKSFQAAVLYHPFEPDFSGSAYSMSFISFARPDGKDPAPQPLTWTIVNDRGRTMLSFSGPEDAGDTQITQLPDGSHFEYYVENAWQSAFAPEQNSIPDAIRVVSQKGTWVVSARGRPAMADIPVELPMFGAYEF